MSIRGSGTPRAKPCGKRQASKPPRPGPTHGPVAAGIDEPPETYVWERLSAVHFEEGAAQGFVHITPSMRHYGIAGVLHMDHLADLVETPTHARMLRRAARETAEALEGDPVGVEHQLHSLLERHAAEWRAFRRALGPDSFVAKLASAKP